jgi:hypothetical protein
MVESNNDGWGEDAKVWGNQAQQMGEQVVLEVTPNVDVKESNEADFVVRITPPTEMKNRVPIDLCCCVDISASMRSAATYED